MTCPSTILPSCKPWSAASAPQIEINQHPTQLHIAFQHRRPLHTFITLSSPLPHWFPPLSPPPHPTCAAFTEILAKFNATAYFDKFLANETLVCIVLKYHILPELLPSSAITNVSVAYPTLLTNSSVYIKKEG